MTYVDDTRFKIAIDVLKRLDAAPDRQGHNKHCWWCPECGDDLAEALSLLDPKVSDAKAEQK